MPAPPPDVAAYLGACPPAHRKVLLALRDVILSVTPDAAEKLSYGIPTVFCAGRSVANYASFTNHCSFFGGYLAGEMGRARKGITVKGSTVQFTTGKPLPKSFVVAVVKARLAANAKMPPPKARRTTKAPSRSPKPRPAAARRSGATSVRRSAKR